MVTGEPSFRLTALMRKSCMPGQVFTPGGAGSGLSASADTSGLAMANEVSVWSVSLEQSFVSRQNKRAKFNRDFALIQMVTDNQARLLFQTQLDIVAGFPHTLDFCIAVGPALDIERPAVDSRETLCDTKPESLI